MGNAVLASYLIGLREGLEATLVVTILLAYLVKTGRRDRLVPLWLGVLAAVALSVAFGALLTYTRAELGYREQELFEGIVSIVAVGLVTWMIFWMRRTARSLKRELTGRLDRALALGGLAVVVMAFLAVVREGLETSLLFFAAVQGATTSAGPLLGILAGLATAVALGWLLYAAAVRIDLARFFTWTGVLLIFVAAGILKYGVHDLQEAGVLPGLGNLAFDVSGTVDPASWYANVLAGTLNLTPAPTVLEMVAWVGYLVPVLVAFLWPGRRAVRKAPAPAPATDTAPADAAPAGPAAPATDDGPRARPGVPA
jgi:high-affinity iron transporter